MTRPRVAVVIPTYDSAAFLPAALASLQRQTLTAWEACVVDDGSTDDTAGAARPFLADSRISYVRGAVNRGLGAALNEGLARTSAPLVSYLPADDRIDPDHLDRLVGAVDDSVVMAWTGVRHHGSQRALAAPPGFCLQLVQVLHRRTGDRWVERAALETDDLDRMMWSALRRRGPTATTGRVTCEWVDHPGQRHKAMRESLDGGLNVFRRRYRVHEPMRFHSSDGWPVDEVELYGADRDRPPTPPAPDGLRIVLVGDLGFNADRVLALEERGHRLFGLWTEDALGDHGVGPVPFGHVEDLPSNHWRPALRDVRPDVIYALLNWRSVPLAHAVLTARTGTPFVWHFKESPMRCMRRGTWPQLAELVLRADATILASDEERNWFELALPPAADRELHVLDGDLPRARWATTDWAPRLSTIDGEAHTVVIGRPIGLDLDLVRSLAGNDVHLHLHGLVRGRGPSGAWQSWLADAREAAPRHVHVHPHVPPSRWVEVFSRYDAAWLHRTTADNDGDIGKATWDDLNVPARLAVSVLAGLPVLQPRGTGSSVAAQRLVTEHGIGLLFGDVDELCAMLRDRAALAEVRAGVIERRHLFTFDHHVSNLVDVFRAAAA